MTLPTILLLILMALACSLLRWRKTAGVLLILAVALLLETRSQNTWQNAQYSADLLKSHPVDQVFLVTSGLHPRRGVLYFARFGIHGQPVRAD